LDHYDDISSHFSKKLGSYFKSTNEQSAPHYKAAERAWRLNPTDNPQVFPGGPISPSVMREFYAKCDAICERASEPTTPAELIRAIFAANIGSKFITSSLLAKTPERPIEYVDMIGYYVDPQPQSQWNKVAVNPSSLPTPGDILTYIDKVNNVAQTILIKDHGSSATRSPFYVVTTFIDKEMDDDSLDQEVSEDVMMKWVQNRIPSA